MINRHPSLNYPEFTHEAMATTFEIKVDCEDVNYACQAADAAFCELDRIETKLSRYDETSDVSKINRAATGVPVVVGYDTFACLKMAINVSDETNGAFDVTSASRFRPGIEFDSTTSDLSEVPEIESRCNLIDLSEDALSVTVHHPGLCIDLGGIGKGYALDRMAEILQEWEVNRTLLIAGGSTALAMDAPSHEKGWPVRFGHGDNSRQVNIRYCSLSGSGLSTKGQHIVDPRSGYPVVIKKRAWALAPTAALSDALSTAFMVLDRNAIEAIHEKHDEIGWALELPDSSGILQLSSRFGQQAR